MSHEYDEDEKKDQKVHPPSTAARTTSKATTSTNPAQLPSWAQESSGEREHGDHLTSNPNSSVR